jgi:CRP/FNR family cyclic AMP-dependent transcriptional regulator
MPARLQPLEQFLSGIPIFGGLEGPTLARVAGLLQEARHPAGTELCSEGDNGRTMYVIRSGEALVWRESPSGARVKLARLGPGEFFGEMTLMDPQPRSASVVIQKDAVLYTLTNRQLYQLYVEDLPGYVMVLQNLCREVTRRLRRADERICELLEEEADPESTQIRPSPFSARRKGR